MAKETLKKMNKSLYAASFHLLEASKHLSNIESFRPVAMELLSRAEYLSNIMEPEEVKISDEKMNSILDEILNFDQIEETKQ
jgi:hypothetical protein